MKEVKKIYKWWWGWNPDKIEHWLESMEANGWHLFHADMGAVRFHFEKHEPGQVRYCVDYQDKITPEYRSLFEDAGWELVYTGLGWYIWRMAYDAERPEIYTDSDSLISRNNRLMGVLGATVAMQLPLYFVLIGGTYLARPFTAAFGVFFIVEAVLFVYGLLKILKYNEKMKKSM